jgi:hypothetical protein
MSKKNRKPALTAEELTWLRQNWNPGEDTFRAWIAGSDHAHRLLGLIIKSEEEAQKKVGSPS